MTSQVTLQTKRLKYRHTLKTIKPWIEMHECVKLYVRRLNANQERTAIYLFNYCEWAGKSPEDLLQLKDTFESSRAERLLDQFAIADTRFPNSIRKLMINSVKAFYRRNYRQLQSAAGQFEYVSTKAQNIPSKETRLKLYRACYTPRDRALVLVACCSGIALESLSLLRWFHFEEDWMRQDVPCAVLPSSIVKGHGRGKYKGVKQIAFFTPETKQALIDYRSWYHRTFVHAWRDDDFVFLSVRDNVHEPLSKDGISNAVQHLIKRAGVKFGVHDGRRVLQTALESVSTNPNWIKKMKGRKPRGEESPYSKPAIEQLREKYREALGELEFLGGVREEGVALTYEDKEKLMAMLRYINEHPEKFG